MVPDMRSFTRSGRVEREAGSTMSSPQEWLEVCRTEYNAASREVNHCRHQLEQAYRALIAAAERYEAAAVAAGEDPLELGLGL